jgi:hypothetical protein
MSTYCIQIYGQTYGIHVSKKCHVTCKLLLRIPYFALERKKLRWHHTLRRIYMKSMPYTIGTYMRGIDKSEWSLSRGYRIYPEGPSLTKDNMIIMISKYLIDIDTTTYKIEYSIDSMRFLPARWSYMFEVTQVRNYTGIGYPRRQVTRSIGLETSTGFMI